MTSKADWPVVPATVGGDGEQRRFFDEHQWATIEAATARIIPTDHDPGAREAGVTRFIDTYLSGIDYVYAAADGSGFLRMDGKLADVWRGRMAAMQDTYVKGIARLDEISEERFGAKFKELNEEQQDQVLETLSGAPKPEPMRLGKGAAASTFLQGTSDEGMDFFQALALHTRQGFYCDPVYGGNKDRIGWKVIGFPGPESLADTNTCKYNVKEYFVLDYDWADLVPYLREEK